MSIDRATGWHLTESPLSRDQHWQVEGELLQIEATVVDSQLLHGWLRGFGPALHSYQITCLPGVSPGDAS